MLLVGHPAINTYIWKMSINGPRWIREWILLFLPPEKGVKKKKGGRRDRQREKKHVIEWRHITANHTSSSHGILSQAFEVSEDKEYTTSKNLACSPTRNIFRC